MDTNEKFIIAEDVSFEYDSENKLLLKDEVYNIIGACMEVHNFFGKGFLENIYKDALGVEFALRNIPYEREKRYDVHYKDKKLPHFFYADFVVSGNIILEVKAQEGVVEEHYKQVINYLAVSKCKVGLIVNFGENSLKYKRVVLTK